MDILAKIDRTLLDNELLFLADLDYQNRTRIEEV